MSALVILVLLLAGDLLVHDDDAAAVEPAALAAQRRVAAANHGNWLVDEVEHYYYSWKAPKKGGPQLKTLPAVGARAAARAGAAARARPAAWPPPIKPVFAHPLPGEGVWEPPGRSSTEATGPRHDVPHRGRLSADRRVRRMVRPHAHVVAYYPGRYEPPNAPCAGRCRFRDQRWRLLATFNSGFIYRDGHNGSSIGGDEVRAAEARPRDVVAYRDGRVDVATWNGGAGRGPADRVRAAEPAADRRPRSAQPAAQRQHPVGLHTRQRRPRLADGRRDRPARQPHLRSRGLPDGHHAREDPAAAGAVRAMQLDINPEWPTLITYTHHGGLDPTKVVPNYQQPATRYLVPDDRDFFAVYRRFPGPVTVPFK